MATVVVAFASCEMHDFFDEDTITGAVGPEAYWEIESSAVKAGGAMGFTAQYYSSVAKIDHSEAWYSISETVAKTVNCSWLSHSETSSVKTMKRVLQYISTFPHMEEFWSDSLHAYTFADAFPVSGTLAPVAWVKPTKFDAEKMKLYFGETYMQDFKDAVKAKMTFATYRDNYQKLGFMNDFKQFTDSLISGSTFSGKYFLQTADIDMSEVSGYLGAGSTSEFAGIYNGNGKKIKVNITSNDDVSVFPNLSASCFCLFSLSSLSNPVLDAITAYPFLIKLFAFSQIASQVFSLNGS